MTYVKITHSRGGTVPRCPPPPVLPPMIPLTVAPPLPLPQELLAAHERLNKNGFQRNKFPSCPTCGQVLVFDDMAMHTAQHFEDGDFPVLD